MSIIVVPPASQEIATGPHRGVICSNCPLSALSAGEVLRRVLPLLTHLQNREPREAGAGRCRQPGRLKAVLVPRYQTKGTKRGAKAEVIADATLLPAWSAPAKGPPKARQRPATGPAPPTHLPCPTPPNTTFALLRWKGFATTCTAHRRPTLTNTLRRMACPLSSRLETSARGTG